MSRAVEICASSGSPLGLAKFVRVMPSERALRVMARANASSVPPSVSATTDATSLADFTASPNIASRTRIVSPGRSPSFEGAREAAKAVTGIASSSPMRFASIASNSM